MATKVALLGARAEERLERQQASLGRPAGVVARTLVVLAAVAALAALWMPVWTLSFQSNQYPDPLELSIYSNHLEGGMHADRDDLKEVNVLNHYIGMHELARDNFPEFVWLPFALGFFVLLALRAAALGSLRDLVDLFVLYVYFAAYSMWSFGHRLFTYGHELASDAPIKVDPFMPPVFGRVKIANFWVESYPGLGAILLLLFAVLVAAALLLTWRRARHARAAA